MEYSATQASAWTNFVWGTRQDLAFFMGKSMDECVEILLTPKPAPLPPVYPATEDSEVIPAGSTFVFAPENKEKERVRLHILKAWWVGQLLDSNRSITEKMTFFWRNHFAVEFNTVKDVRYEYHYLTTLRQYATGNFKKLLRDMTIAPAMLVYLNGNTNEKAAPNENYGRELQELFSVGKGPDSHYTEDDVKAAAKILSGWKDDKKSIGAYFDHSQHNTNDKTFSSFYNNRVIKGRNGDDGRNETDELISMICDNRETAKFLCRKLYRWFVNSNIDEQVEKNAIAPLSEVMINSNYEIQPVLKALFTSAFFYDPGLIGGIVKCPVDFLCGLMHDFDVVFSNERARHYDEWDKIGVALGFMRQDITDPPSVAGWPAYYEFPFYDQDWINSEGLGMRNKAIKYFSHPPDIDIEEACFHLDYKTFISRLSDPSNPAAIIPESTNLLCIVQPGPNKLSYLQGLLNLNQNMNVTWAELWSAAKNNPDKKELETEIDDRLMKLFSVILMLPEYQIM